MNHRLSVGRSYSRRDEGIPGYWAILFVRAACHTSRRVHHLLAKTMVTLLPSGWTNPWAPGNTNVSGPHAAAHTLAYLRIAGVVSFAVARLATDWLARPSGSNLLPSRTGFAPAGRHTKFRKTIASSNSFRTSMAWSHCPRTCAAVHGTHLFSCAQRLEVAAARDPLLQRSDLSHFVVAFGIATRRNEREGPVSYHRGGSEEGGIRGDVSTSAERCVTRRNSFA